jgi:hypothetical protein
MVNTVNQTINRILGRTEQNGELYQLLFEN